MLATIDDITAAKVDRDRKVHGVGYLRVGPDGRVRHVPIDAIRLGPVVDAEDDQPAKVAE